MKQTIYGTTNNLAAQRQRKESTHDVKLGIPPQQGYQNPKHQDRSRQQPCFFLKNCIKPSGNTKHSRKASTSFRAWRKSAKSIKKRAREHLQAKHDIKQYEGNARSASFLQRIGAWKAWQQSTAEPRETMVRANSHKNQDTRQAHHWCLDQSRTK